jgi:hypothetical protein
MPEVSRIHNGTAYFGLWSKLKMCFHQLRLLGNFFGSSFGTGGRRYVAHAYLAATYVCCVDLTEMCPYVGDFRLVCSSVFQQVGPDGRLGETRK